MRIYAVRTYLTDQFLNSSEQFGRVHSVFEHAINLEFENALVTILPDVNAGIPDSIEIANDDFASLKKINVGEIASLKNKNIRIAYQIINIDAQNSNSDWGETALASPEEIERRKSLFGFYHELPPKIEENMQNLLQALNQNNIDECEKILSTTIGLGSGLTPSADDALVGIMAFFHFLENSKCAPTSILPDLVCKLAKGRTTDVSLKYLHCAAQKRFALPLISVVKSLFDANTTEFDFPALAKLLASGHTSGKDTLRGISKAL